MPLVPAPPFRVAPSQSLKFKPKMSRNINTLLKIKTQYKALQRTTEQPTKTPARAVQGAENRPNPARFERSGHKERAAHTGDPFKVFYFMPAAFKIIRTGARMNNNIFTPPPYIMPFSLNSRTSPKRLAMVSSLSTTSKYSEQNRPPAAVLL